MESLGTILTLDINLLPLILVNFAIAIVLLTSLRFVSAWINHVKSEDQLAIKENPAYGISLSGVILGVIIMMTGVMSTEAALDIHTQAIMVTGYGALGIVLMSITRLVFDSVAMPAVSITEEINRGNVAAAAVDAGNVIASALIIRAVMFWVNSYTFDGMLLVLGAYILSQAFLTAVTFTHLRLFRGRHKESMQMRIANGNLALAWRFAGVRIGLALAITAASELVPYAYEGEYLTPVVSWLVLSVIMTILISAFTYLADFIILSGIDVRKEVEDDSNVAVGVVQGALHIAVGLLIVSLMF